MLVRFWGTRGSIPAPGPSTAKYGGNTSCVEVWPDDDTVIIFDSGTGIRELGRRLIELEKRIDRLHLLIGHMHWDHIQGFPFFAPAFSPAIELNIYAPAGFQRSLEDTLSGQMQYSYFPVKLQDLSGRIHYTELEEGFFRLGNVLVETQYLNHTAPSLAYRITTSEATLAYVTDHEPFWNSPGQQKPQFHHPGDQRHIEFLKRCDLVIHDAQYTQEEYRTKRGWGHSTIEYATDIAVAADVERLALFHHDPTHDDAQIEQIEHFARSRASAQDSRLDVFAAAEGMEIKVSGKGRVPAFHRESALRQKSTRGGRILLITDQHLEAAAIERALAEDDLIVTRTPNKKSAMSQIEFYSPDLVICDSLLFQGDEERFIAPIREAASKPDLPVLLLTDNLPVSDAAFSASGGATDYLAKPINPPMLRSRVRAWLARTMEQDSVSIGAVVTAESDAPARPPNAPEFDFKEIKALVSVFQPLTMPQLKRMLAGASQGVYATGHAVINQGRPAHNVYVVLSGRVRIVEALPDNPVEMLLGELGPGEVFGELGIMRDLPRAATAIPLERTVCLIIPESDFVATLKASALMAVALAEVLAGRLYEADRSLARYGPDALTGLPGRRALTDLYSRMAAGARRRGSSLMLLSIDVVHLKAINDRYGYTVGDDVLRAVADVLLKSSRGTDVVCRYRGDEFAALFVEADATRAETVIQRIHEIFRDTVEKRSLPTTSDLRIHYVISPAPPETIEEFLRLAEISGNEPQRTEASPTV
jgi:diguanylate cyclase (GGDEF)-like protein